jgi:putative transposase
VNGKSSGFSRGQPAELMEFAPQELRTYFTTFSTLDRRRVFQVTAHAELMVSTLMGYREQGRFALHSYVVMPDHVHLLITPAHDVSFEKALQYVRGGFSYQLKSKMPIWERGHFDKRVPGRIEYEACVRYIHQNPVVARMVERAEDFQFSSAGKVTDAMPGWMRTARG